MNPADVLTDNLRAQAQALFDAVGATDVAIFGSVAEGTSQPGSDLDLVAKFPPAFNLFNLIDLTEALEALFGHNVDIVSDDPRAGAGIDEIRATSVPLFSR
ncbi:nucleotidyltransferase family protein [Nocardioides rubriscoriae]|uniref:nucleotidyltransferase family protein n=1 Tax=Nocardioides rubriscoriae TaxID=642762 RepID=UPI00147929F1|nr:nucleotidyltransferase domain-containing protein [Nocardioides rubriscoriae]